MVRICMHLDTFSCHANTTHHVRYTLIKITSASCRICVIWCVCVCVRVCVSVRITVFTCSIKIFYHQRFVLVEHTV